GSSSLGGGPRSTGTAYTTSTRSHERVEAFHRGAVGADPFDGGNMKQKFKGLVGASAVAGLVLAGAVGASAVPTETTELVGYFEVQDKVANPTPAGWFSEGDDGIADVSFNL